jgi:hypothetical protein
MTKNPPFFLPSIFDNTQLHPYTQARNLNYQVNATLLFFYELCQHFTLTLTQNTHTHTQNTHTKHTHKSNDILPRATVSPLLHSKI